PGFGLGCPHAGSESLSRTCALSAWLDWSLLACVLTHVADGARLAGSREEKTESVFSASRGRRAAGRGLARFPSSEKKGDSYATPYLACGRAPARQQRPRRDRVPRSNRERGRAESAQVGRKGCTFTAAGGVHERLRRQHRQHHQD